MKLTDIDKFISTNDIEINLDEYSKIINKYIEKIDIRPKMNRFIREKDGQAYIRKEKYKDNNQVTYEDIPLHKWVTEKIREL